MVIKGFLRELLRKEQVTEIQMVALDPPCTNQGAPVICRTPHLSDNWQKVLIKDIGVLSVS